VSEQSNVSAEVGKIFHQPRETHLMFLGLIGPTYVLVFLPYLKTIVLNNVVVIITWRKSTLTG